MAKLLKPDYSILEDLDIWREYTREEIESLYNRVNHLNNPEQVAEIKRRAKTSALGNPFEIRKIRSPLSSNRLHEIKLFSKINSFDEEHEKFMILEKTGKISRNELNKQMFISWFKKEIVRLRKNDVQ